MSHVLKTIEETRDAMDGVTSDKKIMLVNSLVTLSKKVIAHILAFRDVPVRFEAVLHPAIAAQLQAAETRTEKAADDIMTATERIAAILPGLQEEERAAIQVQVNALFEACNFQDLVAQHLNEIHLLVGDLSRDMKALAAGMEDVGGGEGGGRPRREERPDSHLLNGPTTQL